MKKAFLSILGGSFIALSVISCNNGGEQVEELQTTVDSLEQQIEKVSDDCEAKIDSAVAEVN